MFTLIAVKRILLKKSAALFLSDMVACPCGIKHETKRRKDRIV